MLKKQKLLRTSVNFAGNRQDAWRMDPLHQAKLAHLESVSLETTAGTAQTL